MYMQWIILCGLLTRMEWKEFLPVTLGQIPFSKTI